MSIVCLHNDDDELVFVDEEIIKAWVEHYIRLLPVEF